MGLFAPGAFRRAKSAAFTYAFAVGPSNPRAFVIFGLGRSGSTLLTELLGSHPEIRCEQEILSRRRAWPFLYVTGRRNKASSLSYGFKVKIWHLSETQGMTRPEDFLSHLHRDGWMFIHLWRRNALRTALSKMLADARKCYHVKDTTEQQMLLSQTFTLPPAEVVKNVDHVLEQRSWEDRLMERIPHHSVVYEDDLLNPDIWQDTADRIFDYLGLRRAPVHSDLKRTTGGHPEEDVSNFNDVVNEVLNAGHGRYLSTLG